MATNRANDQKAINFRAILGKGILLACAGGLFIVFAKFGIQAGLWTTALLMGGSLPLLLVLSGMNRDIDRDDYDYDYEETPLRGKVPARLKIPKRVRPMHAVSSAPIPWGIKTAQRKPH